MELLVILGVACNSGQMWSKVDKCGQMWTVVDNLILGRH